MTAIEPPEGLLDKMAEAMFCADCESDGVAPEDRDWLWAGDSEPIVAEIYTRKARAAWDAVVEGLGLWEQMRYVEPITPYPEPTPIERRLVSRWEPTDAS